jgi:outer membrane protein
LRRLALTSLLDTERARGRVLSILVAVMLAVAAPRLYAQGVRVAVVDMQQALLETNEGRRAKTQLKRLFDTRQAELNTRQEALKRMKDDIDKQKNVVAREALEKRMTDYQTELVKLQQNFVESQQELAQKEAELTKSILVNLQGVVQRLGETSEFDLVLDRGSVVWARTQFDVTAQVIRDYNTAHPSSGGGTAPAGPGGTRPGTRPAAPAPRPTAAPGAGPHPRAPAP